MVNLKANTVNFRLQILTRFSSVIVIYFRNIKKYYVSNADLWSLARASTWALCWRSRRQMDAWPRSAA